MTMLKSKIKKSCTDRFAECSRTARDREVAICELSSIIFRCMLRSAFSYSTAVSSSSNFFMPFTGIRTAADNEHLWAAFGWYINIFIQHFHRMGRICFMIEPIELCAVPCRTPKTFYNVESNCIWRACIGHTLRRHDVRTSVRASNWLVSFARECKSFSTIKYSARVLLHTDTQ